MKPSVVKALQSELAHCETFDEQAITIASGVLIALVRIAEAIEALVPKEPA